MKQPAKTDLDETTNRFTRWRKGRPFAGGLFMILSGIIMITPAYLSFEVSNIVIQVATISGVSTLLIGALLITCGLMCWFKAETRLLAGVAAMILGIVALPLSNLGGFVIGTLCALIGGALALSWAPGRKDRGGVANEPAEGTAVAEDAEETEAEAAGDHTADNYGEQTPVAHDGVMEQNATAAQPGAARRVDAPTEEFEAHNG